MSELGGISSAIAAAKPNLEAVSFRLNALILKNPFASQEVALG